MNTSARNFAALYFTGCCFVMSAGVLLPGKNGPVAVFAKPWGDPAIEVVARANGPLMVATQPRWVVVTQANETDFVSKLYQAGAGFVASAAVAYACARLNGTNLEQLR